MGRGIEKEGLEVQCEIVARAEEGAEEQGMIIKKRGRLPELVCRGVHPFVS